MRVRIEGTVQGVGFRPHVYRLARALALDGHVRNEADAVVVEAEGTANDVDRFVAAVAAEALRLLPSHAS